MRPGIPHSGLAHRTASSKVSVVWQLVREFVLFLKQEKKWWLIPVVAVLLLLGAVIVFTSSSALAPFLYPFM